ncbi:GspH/FimT family pseudopilin [Pseudomonas oryzihabitans]|uniref:GspH/FimT family pseudopilin n=1 Tax=Pseudomonas oryzihabitans TaxID=47885 RepID=UPI0028950FA7|nr:GspH/FimT family pseudopilin [Pseudomonas oryzihabitans]MDT3721847.1 GspH/FimT family pseudopilin [Pseudomonas oryzihabitans]
MSGHQAGFTLLELMVVLLIVGLLTAVGVARLGGGSPAGQWRLESLATDFQLARDTARRSGRVLGWQADATGFRYLQLVADAQGPRWQPLASADLPDGRWPSGLQLAEPVSAQPRLIWWPNGDTRPQRLAFAEEERQWLLTVDARGRAAVGRP